MTIRAFILYTGLLLVNTSVAMQPAAHTTDTRQLTYHIETHKTEQTIRHFGASDAWSMQYVGLWPDEQQSQIADWLFSTENDAHGQPKGIGLSVWRFNLGAGSAEQGDSSHIQPSTRTECFLRPDGAYDWTKQRGQRHFLQLAKERGVPHFLAFMNSSPVQFTKNGLATNTGRDGTLNLREECYPDVARFAAKVMKELEKRTVFTSIISVRSTSPMGTGTGWGPSKKGRRPPTGR